MRTQIYRDIKEIPVANILATTFIENLTLGYYTLIFFLHVIQAFVLVLIRFFKHYVIMNVFIYLKIPPISSVATVPWLTKDV